MLHHRTIVSLWTHGERGTKPPQKVNNMENVTTSKLLGRSIIIRKRKALKRPFSYSQGECYHKLSGGLWSLYVEHKGGRGVNISIDDR
jgi:hypothetical protein